MCMNQKSPKPPPGHLSQGRETHVWKPVHEYSWQLVSDSQKEPDVLQQVNG